MAARARRSRMPDGFAVRERVREFTATRYGLYHLADVLGAEFIAYHKRRDEEGRPALYVDWSTALINFIKGEAPLDAPGDGRFHNPAKWARWCALARDMEKRAPRASSTRDARRPEVPVAAAAAAAALSAAPGFELELGPPQRTAPTPAPAPRPAPEAARTALSAARALLAAAPPIPTKQRRSTT